jgi:hypothetical protein
MGGQLFALGTALLAQHSSTGHSTSRTAQLNWAQLFSHSTTHLGTAQQKEGSLLIATTHKALSNARPQPYFPIWEATRACLRLGSGFKLVARVCQPVCHTQGGEYYSSAAALLQVFQEHSQ